MAQVTGQSSLIKTILHKSLAEAVYKDLVTKNSNYYYFLGRTLLWDDELSPLYPIDSYAYERLTRSEIITLKQITPNDVSFVIPRINWTSGLVYDMYDDEYSDEILGLDIVSGGVGFTSLPTITVSGGGGTGARFNPVVSDGKIIDIEVVSRGTGYTSDPTVTITGGGGTGAIIRAYLNSAYSGTVKLEDSNFYVMTDEFNVYKCLDNNNNSISTSKPLGSSVAPIITADGYIWKFMYNVPISLRNKFLSNEQIPVVSALTNQFYSNGALESIIVDAKGSGYTSASIIVDGDGYLEEDPIFLQSVNVSAGGSGYSTPTVTITPPFQDASQYIALSEVFLGQKIFNTNLDYYEVVSAGTLSAAEPTHKRNTIINGSAALKYIGTTAKATASVSSGVVTGINLIGGVRDVSVLSPGSGYTTAPSVNFSGGGGSGAQAIVKLNSVNGSILYVTVINSGDNYTSAPTVTFGNEWTAGEEVFVGDQYYYSNRLYTVTVNGTFGSTEPIHTTGTATNGTATLEYVGSPATGISTRRYGAGYLDTPLISITESGGSGAEAFFTILKSEAKLFPIIESGEIVGVNIQNPGIGYSVATLSVNGDGSGAQLSADLNLGNISSLQANNEILTEAGTINAIKIVSGGYGYGVANIVIEGDGEGAAATATIESGSGRITKINITNTGRNYTFANVRVVGNGFGAKFRVIMPPYGGHGKNSPDELFARTLMFYSNVSTDLNQGIEVNNDYRQLGIIKNIRFYNLNRRYTATLGSACFVVEGNIDTSFFPRDTDIFVNRVIGGETFQRRYRVVSSTSTSALLQSLDNDTVLINDIFTNSAGQTFTAVSVGFPTVDKYSGQLMFIDNKTGFTPSQDETVILRTVIKF